MNLFNVSRLNQQLAAMLSTNLKRNTVAVDEQAGVVGFFQLERMKYVACRDHGFGFLIVVGWLVVLPDVKTLRQSAKLFGVALHESPNNQNGFLQWSAGNDGKALTHAVFKFFPLPTAE